MTKSGEKITILHVLSNFKGEYPLFNQVVQGLNEGYRHIVCYLVGPPSCKEVLCKAGYDIKWLPFRKEELRSFKYHVVRELDRIIKENGVHIIHAHRHKSAFYATIAALKNRNVRMITSVHGMKRSRSLLRKISNRILWPRINTIIAVSEAVKRDILMANYWFPADRIEVVHNGIDLSVFKRNDLVKMEARTFFNLPPRRWLWGAVGRLAPVKGHDILLKAWARNEIGKRGGHLVIAGKGRLHDSLTALAEKLGIAKEITLLGHVSDIPKFLAALDGFAMPSLHEGFPLAILEALAAGLPVVSSKVGGIPEILTLLESNKYSFLVPSENEEKLGNAMEQVMGWSETHRQQAVTNIKQHAQLFDGNLMIARMDSLYRDIVGFSFNFGI